MSLYHQVSQHEALEATVARLVAEALRACEGDLVTCPVQATSSSAQPAVIPADDAVDSQVLGEQVISVQLLESLKRKTAVLQIGAKAVVTPAAKDWLRQHSVRANRVARSSGSGGPVVVPTGAVLLADTGMHDRATALVRQLSIRGLSAEATDLETLTRACQSDSAALGVVISPLPVIELDLLSRVHSVRTAAADSIEMARRILGRFNPRAWVLDAERLNLSSLVVVAETCIRNQAIGPKEAR